MKTSILADLLGILVVFSAISIAMFAMRPPDSPIALWIIGYIVLAVISVGICHADKWPKRSRECLELAGGSLILGALFFAADILLGHLHHPELPVLRAATQSGGPFGFFLTLVVCPGLTVIALGGFLRSLLLSRRLTEV
jgi:hypothetical protein